MKRDIFSISACLATVASVAVTFAASGAQALPASSYIITYYTDASESTLAGTHWLSCSGNHKQLGVVTPYSETESESCEVGGGGEGDGMECLLLSYNYPDGEPAQYCGYEVDM